tara:strand:+ start:174 stop:350 length:177 start_codon:yes stop_codon:yes gene_type:complete
MKKNESITAQIKKEKAKDEKTTRINNGITKRLLEKYKPFKNIICLKRENEKAGQKVAA